MKQGAAPALPLDPDQMARWGIDYDPAAGTLSVAPQLIPGERRAASPAFRVGRTVVSLGLRVAPSTVVLDLSVTFGPPIRLEVQLPGATSAADIQVDGISLTGPRVSFEARDRHEVCWVGLERTG